MASAASRSTFNRVLLLILVVGIGFGVWQQRRVRELEEQLRFSAETSVALQAELEAAEAAASRVAVEAEAGLPPPMPEEDSVRPVRAAPGPVFNAPAMRFRDIERSLWEDTEYQKAVLRQLRGSLDARYATLFQHLELAPAELEQLKDLLVERLASRRDIFLAARTGESPPSPEAMEALIATTQAEVDAGIHALLGDERFQEYQNFNENSGPFDIADRLQRRLSYTAAPLTPAQSGELVRIMRAAAEAEEPPTPPGGERDWVFATPFGAFSAVPALDVRIAGGGGQITDEMLNQAANILTPLQQAALEELQAEQQAQATLVDAMRRAAGEAMAGAAGP